MSRVWGKRVAWLIIIAVAVLAAVSFGRKESIERILAWVAGLGTGGAVAFILVYVLACVLLVPGVLLSLGAGALFGVVQGSLLVWTGAMAGATAAFLIARYAARDFIRRKIGAHPHFAALDHAIAEKAWIMVILVRLSPLFPFNILNYAFGLTSVRFREYVLGSAVGIVPGVVMYTYIGSLAGTLARLDGADRTRTTGEWILSGAGLAAAVAVTLYLARVARRTLRNRLPT